MVEMPRFLASLGHVTAILIAVTLFVLLLRGFYARGQMLVFLGYVGSIVLCYTFMRLIAQAIHVNPVPRMVCDESSCGGFTFVTEGMRDAAHLLSGQLASSTSGEAVKCVAVALGGLHFHSLLFLNKARTWEGVFHASAMAIFAFGSMMFLGSIYSEIQRFVRETVDMQMLGNAQGFETRISYYRELIASHGGAQEILGVMNTSVLLSYVPIGLFYLAAAILDIVSFVGFAFTAILLLFVPLRAFVGVFQEGLDPLRPVKLAMVGATVQITAAVVRVGVGLLPAPSCTSTDAMGVAACLNDGNFGGSFSSDLSRAALLLLAVAVLMVVFSLFGSRFKSS